MDYPGSNDGGGPSAPRHPAAGKKKKSAAARRVEALTRGRREAARVAEQAVEEARLQALYHKNPNFMPPPPAPASSGYGVSNDIMVASNPFDDNQPNRSQMTAQFSAMVPPRVLPPQYPDTSHMQQQQQQQQQYPGNMDLAMHSPNDIQQQQYPMNLNYATTAMVGGNSLPQDLRTVGQAWPPEATAARGEPPPYPQSHDASINTTCRKHMSIGNVNVQQQQQQQPSASSAGQFEVSMPPPSLPSHLSPPFGPQPTSRKRKGPTICIPQGLPAPYRPHAEYAVDGRLLYQQPMSSMPQHLMGRLPFVPALHPAATAAAPILQNQLMQRPRAPQPTVNPPEEMPPAPMFFTPGELPKMEQQPPPPPPPQLDNPAPNCAVCPVCLIQVYEGQDPIVCMANCQALFHRICVKLSKMAYNLLLSTPRCQWACHVCQTVVPPIKYVAY